MKMHHHHHSNSSLQHQFELTWPHLKSFNDSSLEGEDSVVPSWSSTDRQQYPETYGDSTSEKLAKVLAMVVLGIGSLAAGLVPSLISSSNRRRFPILTSLLLCFGAGVLLSTALVHILPEVRHQLNNDWAEIIFCMGFFGIYFTDEFIHYFFGNSHHHHDHRQHCPPVTQNTNSGGLDIGGGGNVGHGSSTVCPSHESSSQYGSLNSTDNESLLNQLPTTPSGTEMETTNGRLLSEGNGGGGDVPITVRECSTANTIIHVPIEKRRPARQEIKSSKTGTFGLLVALSLHSSIEGLAIGVQDSAAKVFFLLGAVSSHKLVMAFCLGLELYSNPCHQFRSHLLAIMVFALGAVLGIATGMLLVDLPEAWNASTILPIVQGLAGGTLLYVTVCEVIPREKSRPQNQRRLHKLVGFSQLLSIIVGFILMCLINHFLEA